MDPGMSIRGSAYVAILVADFFGVVISNPDGPILAAVDENTWTRFEP